MKRFITEQGTLENMATTHPEYNERTTATEVAKAFADQIRDKNGVLDSQSDP